MTALEEAPAPEPRWHYRADCVIEPSGEVVVTQTDPRLAARLGYSVEDLERSGGWMSRTPPEDLDRSLQAVKLLTQGKVWEGRVRTRSASDDLVILQVRSTPTRLGDGRVSVRVDLRDVTEVARLETALAQRDAQLRLLERQMTVLVWSTDDALRFTWSSGPALSGLGYQENALVGTTLYELFESDDWIAPPIAAHHRALTGESADYEVEWQDRRWRCFLEPLRDELGRIAGVLGVAVDMSLFRDTAEATRAAQVDAKGWVRPPTPDPRLDVGPGSEAISLDGLVIDPERFVVLKQGRKISLTVTEFKLLMEFARRPGRVLSRDVLAERVWGQNFFGHTASVTMAISRLRDKIEDDPSNPSLIQTVRGVGYRLADGDGRSV